MDAFWLYSRGGSFLVSRRGIQSESTPPGDVPTVLGPSVTFRKHFQVPADLDRDRDQVLREMFANFLPGGLSDYHCQFVVNNSDEASLDVLGLAVDRTTLDDVVDSEASPDPVVCFERLIADHGFSRSTCVEIPFPTGRYFGVFHGSVLWSRFLRNARDAECRQTREYVEEHFPGVQNRPSVPEWEVGSAGAQWAEVILSWLPDRPEPEHELLGTAGTSLWERYRTRAWVLLALTLIALLVWIGVHYRTQSAIEARIDREFEVVFERSSRFPVDELESQVARLEDRDRGAALPLQYPRLVQVDQAFDTERLQLLRLSLTEEGGRLIFVAPSLELAESVRDDLQDAETVQDASITSTSSDVEDGFEVNLRLQWRPPTRG